MKHISLSTDILPTVKIKTNLLNADATGETAMNKFIHEGLVNMTTLFYELLRELKLGVDDEQG